MGEERGGREAVALIRLHVIVEGQTEEAFVNAVLAPELGLHGVFADAHSITTGRRHGRLFRGGLLKYEHLARDLLLWMKQDAGPDSWFTTMIDLYHLPVDFPGRETMPANLAGAEKVAHLEERLAADLAVRLGSAANARRLIPYIQLHEFEALLFSDARAFSEAFPADPSRIAQLADIRGRFASPEDINEGPQTCPSKRILRILPDYDKPVAGPLIAQRIGLAVLRRECGHFDRWCARLMALADQASEPETA